MRTTAQGWEGAGITITYQDWNNAAAMRRVLESFKDATEALEGDNITLPFVPCIVSVLDSHVEAESCCLHLRQFMCQRHRGHALRSQ